MSQEFIIRVKTGTDAWGFIISDDPEFVKKAIEHCYYT